MAAATDRSRRATRRAGREGERRGEAHDIMAAATGTTRRACASILAVWLLCGGFLCLAQTDSFRVKPNAAQCAKPKPVCIFDFDHTLHIGPYHCCGRLANEALNAVDKCLAEGFDIAIASANTHWAYVRSFLRNNIPPFRSLLQTEAVQTGHWYKTTTLNAVLRHYNASSEPQCAVFFDDLWSNKQYADATGVHFVKIIPDSGISEANVEAGMQAAGTRAHADSKDKQQEVRSV
eukprot:CAMPEP_0197487002 /NCGR_PEP_ID=MMETSP1311-20131121/2017_1 /TAXON_ID=464262 /ORGANISM="Genus nov. species nov., Strain RCC856" /LENGTH=233 /DNA_ID=CAMNT_0043030443 /DNA_START=10 /DNA_END=712 /DNA_ORIENTATION=-